MCLGIPGEVVELDDPSDANPLPQGVVSFGGVKKTVCLAYTPEARPGDFVIVHAGFALSIVDPEEAERVFEALGQIEEIEASQANQSGPS